MFFLIPTLMLRKPTTNPNQANIGKCIKARLNRWVIAEFEMDVVLVGNTDSSNFGSKRDPKEANYHKASNLIKTGQLRRARQAILSTGCSDPTIPHIQEQMGAKFPKRKKNNQHTQT